MSFLVEISHNLGYTHCTHPGRSQLAGSGRRVGYFQKIVNFELWAVYKILGMQLIDSFKPEPISANSLSSKCKLSNFANSISVVGKIARAAACQPWSSPKCVALHWLAVNGGPRNYSSSKLHGYGRRPCTVPLNEIGLLLWFTRNDYDDITASPQWRSHCPLRPSLWGPLFSWGFRRDFSSNVRVGHNRWRPVSL